MKIERINSQVVKLGDDSYITGAVYADYTNRGVDFYHKNGGNSYPIAKEIAYDEITNSAGVPFGTRAQVSAAIAAAIAPGDGISSILSDRGTVAQATSATTAVTLNKQSGTITTVAQTLAADSELTFTVNNSKVNTESIVVPTLIYPAANTGTPVVNIGAINAGSFTIVLSNVNPAAALNSAANVLKIGFLVA